MSLLQAISDRRKESLKNGEKTTSQFLSFVYSRALAVGKNAVPPHESTDSEVITALKKLVKETQDTIAQGGDKLDAAQSARLNGEIAILETFLPSQISEAELRTAITTAIGDQPKSMKLMKVVMSHLQANYEGQYDNALASKIAKEMLTA